MASSSNRERKLLQAIETDVFDHVDRDTDAELAKDLAAYEKIESLFDGLRQPGEENDVPAQVGRYEVKELLGRGAFGSVYLAHDPKLDRSVAVKVPNSQRFPTETDAVRFVEEARLTASLRHPSIVTVHDVGLENGRCYLVLDYIKGEDLESALRSPSYSYREAAELVATVAGALQFAHKKGFVHRDLKPGNILLDEDGQPQVSDFGLAVSEDSQRLLAGQIAGTLAYMSPEQVRGDAHHLDGRSDIWSLGVILYELLTGRHPLWRWRGDVAECIEKIQNREAKPPRQIDENIPAELERIVLKCLTKDPTQRYTTAKDLKDDLNSYLLVGSQKNGKKLPIVGFAALAVCLAGWAVWLSQAPVPPGPDEQLARLLDLAYKDTITGQPPTLAIAPQAVYAGEEGRWQPLEDGAELSNEDSYRVTVVSEGQAFLYVWQVDILGKVFWLYPRNETCASSTGANPIAAASLVHLPPNRDEGFVLDDTAGVEHLYVAASPTRWTELEEGLATAAAAVPREKKPIVVPFGRKTRGVLGIRKLPLDGQAEHVPPDSVLKSGFQLPITGVQGALVKEIWFRHVTSPGQ